VPDTDSPDRALSLEGELPDFDHLSMGYRQAANPSIEG
jgi:hypothetical protein